MNMGEYDGKDLIQRSHFPTFDIPTRGLIFMVMIRKVAIR